MRRTVAFAVMVTTVVAGVSGCGGGSKLPDSLFGAWTGGNAKVTTVSFTSGGRMEINGGSCAGSYVLTAVGEKDATLKSGHLECPDLGLNGYVTATVSMDGSSLNLSGFPVGGLYKKA